MVMQGGLSEQSARDLADISVLMDGELDKDAAEREIARIKVDAVDAVDAPLREAWDTYHLIGDAMRGAANTLESSRKDVPSFGLRFSERLALEPTVLAPHSQPVRREPRKFQTYALRAAASVAAVTVVGWVAVNTLRPLGSDSAPTAVAQAPVVQTQQPQTQTLVPVSVTVEPIHQYLLAHQGISPTTAFQGVAPYIRTVSSADE
jgi:sigma-E factor negative regulatory protein RseA